MSTTNNKDMSGWFDIGAAAVGGVAGLASRIGQKKREKRQMGYQKELMGIQQQNQMALNQQGQELAMKTWRETNFPAQRLMMEEAGLNPALMYSQGGGGGATTSSGSGGAASGGAAPDVENIPMDIGNALAAAQTSSQIRLNNAQAEKLLADADSTRGEEGTIGASIISKNMADALNTEQIKELNKIAVRVSKATEETQIETAEQELENLFSQYDLNKANEAKARANISLMAVQERLMESNITLNDAQIDKMRADIIQKGQELQLEAKRLQTLVTKNKIDANMANFRISELEWQMSQDIVKNNIEWAKIKQSNMNGIYGLIGQLGLGGLVGGILKGKPAPIGYK